MYVSEERGEKISGSCFDWVHKKETEKRQRENVAGFVSPPGVFQGTPHTRFFHLHALFVHEEGGMYGFPLYTKGAMVSVDVIENAGSAAGNDATSDAGVMFS